MYTLREGMAATEEGNDAGQPFARDYTSAGVDPFSLHIYVSKPPKDKINKNERSIH